MRRPIFASEDADLIMNTLRALEIDTSTHRYELSAAEYGRHYDGGKKYVKRFAARGDYLALFSMVLHKAPTFANLTEYYDFEDILNLIEQYPSYYWLKGYAEYNWWGDGDDYIFHLKNLDTGEYLYQAEDDLEEVTEEDEEDW